MKWLKDLGLPNYGKERTLVIEWSSRISCAQTLPADLADKQTLILEIRTGSQNHSGNSEAGSWTTYDDE